MASLGVLRGTAYAYEGNYAVWLKKKQERLDMDNKKDRARARQMAEELEWLGKGAKAQQKKSKARRKRVEAMKSEDEEARVTKKYLSGQVLIPPGPRLGKANVHHTLCSLWTLTRPALHQATKCFGPKTCQ